MLTRASIQTFLTHLSLNGASANTTRAYETDLRQAHAAVGDQQDWPSCEVALAGYLTAHRADWAPKTTNRRLTTFRSWAKHSGAPGTFLGDYRAPTPARPEPHPIPEGIDGVRRMIATTRNPKHRVLCVMTGMMGMRIGEAIAVKPEHVDMKRREITVRGKGDRTRVLPISNEALPYIERALRRAKRDQTATLVTLSNRGARKAVKRHARNAGLIRDVATHDLRATFATAVYGATQDLRVTQELLGHADPSQTQVYVGVAEQTKRAAVEAIARIS